MFIVARKGTKLDKQNPTLLYGYGGETCPTIESPATAMWCYERFCSAADVACPQDSIFPWSQHFQCRSCASSWRTMASTLSPTSGRCPSHTLLLIAAVLIHRNADSAPFGGGRGGGEYGTMWREQGSIQNKQNVFDDFQACATFLDKQGYCSSEKLTIQVGCSRSRVQASSYCLLPACSKAKKGIRLTRAPGMLQGGSNGGRASRANAMKFQPDPAHMGPLLVELIM